MFGKIKLIVGLILLALPFAVGAQTDSIWVQDGVRYISDAGIPREYLRSFDSLLAATHQFDYLSDECNLDNTVYLPGKEFIFDYYYEKDGARYRVNTDGRLVGITDTSENVILQVGYKIEHGNCLGETQMRYQYRLKERVDDLFEVSGIIENNRVAWLHPPRSIIFGVLEVIPFPYIDKPAAAAGRPWHWELKMGGHEYLWFIKPPVEQLINRITYTATGKDTCLCMGKNLSCTVIEAIAENEAGVSRLKSWYNDQYGFIRLAGVNVDGSKWNFELKQLALE